MNSLETEIGEHADSHPSRSRFWHLGGYLWLLLKNVIGWALILAALVVGPLVPGPGGIPLFLIGFALIWFPGKRRLTARVLRGNPVRLRIRPFLLVSIAIALVLPAVILALPRTRWLSEQNAHGALALSVYLMGVIVTWLLAWTSPRALNLLLRIVARARQKVRPWLRHHHVHLLAPRLKPPSG